MHVYFSLAFNSYLLSYYFTCTSADTDVIPISYLLSTGIAFWRGRRGDTFLEKYWYQELIWAALQKQSFAWQPFKLQQLCKGLQHQRQNVSLHHEGLQVCRDYVWVWKSLKFISYIVEVYTDITKNSCLEGRELQAFLPEDFPYQTEFFYFSPSFLPGPERKWNQAPKQWKFFFKVKPHSGKSKGIHVHFTRWVCSEVTFCTIYAASGSLKDFQTHQWKLHLYLTIFSLFQMRNRYHWSLFYHILSFPGSSFTPDIWAYCSTVMQKHHAGIPWRRQAV